MQTNIQKKPHSADYFGEVRDFWWNRDFLDLMSRRWKLDPIHHVLDLGCGIGHWGQLLLSLLPAKATMIGVDREPKWIEQAEEKSKKLNLDSRVSYQLGSAEKLQFADKTFDMVTCQTLLIHVQDPRLVLKEMLRVLKPNGLLVVAEPNNLNPSLDSLYYEKLKSDFKVEEQLLVAKLQMVCSRGKYLLGEGFSSIGDLVSGFFAELGLKNIQVYLSDKTSSLFPPYESKEQQVLIQQSNEWSKQDFVTWNREDTLRYFLAGGGSQDEFEMCWALVRKKMQEHLEALQQKKYHTAGGAWMYLVSGQKESV